MKKRKRKPRYFMEIDGKRILLSMGNTIYLCDECTKKPYSLRHTQASYMPFIYQLDYFGRKIRYPYINWDDDFVRIASWQAMSDVERFEKYGQVYTPPGGW